MATAFLVQGVLLMTINVNTRVVINIFWTNFQDIIYSGASLGEHHLQSSKFYQFLSKFIFSPFSTHSTCSGPFPCYPLLEHKLIPIVDQQIKLSSFRRKWPSYGQFSVTLIERKHENSHQCYINLLLQRTFYTLCRVCLTLEFVFVIRIQFAIKWP